MRFADFRKTSRLGCPECYEAFSAELDSLLEGMHRSRQHAGKVPSRAVIRPSSVAAQMIALKQALDAAIGAEDYEEAARLRDRIRQESEAGRESAASEGKSNEAC